MRLILAIMVMAVGLAACGGGSGDAPEQPTVSQPAQTKMTAESATFPEPTATQAVEPAAAEPLPGLPGDITGYDGWTKLNARPIPPRDSDPHLGTKNVYTSLEAGGDGIYPDGAIIVKDAVRPDTEFVGLVAIMRKEAGSDPAHDDWTWVEYTRDSADAPFDETASGDVCTSCHIGAEDTDWVWIEKLGLTR